MFLHRSAYLIFLKNLAVFESYPLDIKDERLYYHKKNFGEGYLKYRKLRKGKSFSMSMSFQNFYSFHLKFVSTVFIRFIALQKL